jgi:hypothetical protein
MFTVLLGGDFKDLPSFSPFVIIQVGKWLQPFAKIVVITDRKF